MQVARGAVEILARDGLIELRQGQLSRVMRIPGVVDGANSWVSLLFITVGVDEDDPFYSQVLIPFLFQRHNNYPVEPAH